MTTLMTSSYHQPGKSVALHWHGRAHESPSKPYNIVLHHTLAQDILLDLGTPSRRYTKQDNRFEGMYGQGQEREDRTRARKGEKTWWNYFQLGLDFLVDDNNGGVIVKVMAHSNIVSHTGRGWALIYGVRATLMTCMPLCSQERRCSNVMRDAHGKFSSPVIRARR